MILLRMPCKAICKKILSMSTPYGLIHCASCSNWLLFVPYSRIRIVLLCVIASFLPLIGCNEWKSEQLSCLEVLMQGNVQQVAKIREQRFLGKIPSKRAHCLGGDHAVALNGTPWFDWPNYWAAGDKTSLSMDAPLLDIIFLILIDVESSGHSTNWNYSG